MFLAVIVICLIIGCYFIYKAVEAYPGSDLEAQVEFIRDQAKHARNGN